MIYCHEVTKLRTVAKARGEAFFEHGCISRI